MPTCCCLCQENIIQNEEPVVIYPCAMKCRFHWDCIVSEENQQFEINKCPQCSEAVVSTVSDKDDNADNLLNVSIQYEDGEIDEMYNILPTLKEERDPIFKQATLLMDSCFVGDEQAVVQITGSNPEKINELVNKQDNEKHWTALFYATVAGRTQLVRYLAEQCGADVNVIDVFGNTCVDYAIEEKYNDLVSYLSSCSSSG